MLWHNKQTLTKIINKQY